MLPSYINLFTQYIFVYRCGKVSYQCGRKGQCINIKISTSLFSKSM